MESILSWSTDSQSLGPILPYLSASESICVGGPCDSILPLSLTSQAPYLRAQLFDMVAMLNCKAGENVRFVAAFVLVFKHAPKTRAFLKHRCKNDWM